MNKEVLRMPSKITKDMYFKRDTYEKCRNNQRNSTFRN